MTCLDKIHEAGFQVHLGSNGNLLVIPSSKLSKELKKFIKDNKPNLINELKQNARELSQIEKWMRDKGETDQEVIDEILERCQRLPEARGYYLKRAIEVRR